MCVVQAVFADDAYMHAPSFFAVAAARVGHGRAARIQFNCRVPDADVSAAVDVDISAHPRETVDVGSQEIG